jgi:hypothetical protein
MKKMICLLAGLALAVPMFSVSMDATAAGKGKTQRSQRGELVHRIVMRWGGHVQEAYLTDVREWASDMVPVFGRASIDQLQRAADARTFEAMNNAFLANGEQVAIQQNALVTNPRRIVSRTLGEAANDLVFVPVTPCRIIDTRNAGGQMAAGSTRGFDITAVSDYSFQGGNASNCGGAGAAGSFAAAAINFTVVFPAGGGFLTAYPLLESRPLSSTMDYDGGGLRSTLAIVKLDQGASANEINVYAHSTTHLVADIVGYFINPQATPLECIEMVSAGGNITAGSFGTQSTPTCTAGYTITGGGCSMSTFDGRVVTSRSIVNTGGTSQTHFCAFRNEGANTIEGVAYSRCCRTPGRI